jgi:hypothetical protein
LSSGRVRAKAVRIAVPCFTECREVQPSHEVMVMVAPAAVTTVVEKVTGVIINCVCQLWLDDKTHAVIFAALTQALSISEGALLGKAEIDYVHDV